MIRKYGGWMNIKALFFKRFFSHFLATKSGKITAAEGVRDCFISGEEKGHASPIKDMKNMAIERLEVGKITSVKKNDSG